MSQPRHQPRNTPDVKLRLRLPTDGSVDLDKLRAALEAQLKTGTASVAEPVEVEEPKVLPELEVLPQLEPAREPNAAWVWVRQNTPTTVALVSAVAAFVFAVTWGMQRVGGGEAHSLVKWGFILAALSLLGAFGTVVVRKLRETAASDGETLAEPLVEPEPEGSFQFGVWLSQNAPTYVAVFTFALAFVTGIIWVTLKSTGEGNISSSLYWVIGINMALFLVSMGFVLIRQLKIADSAASHVWTNVKADPKKAYLPALGFIGVVVLVFLGLTLIQDTPSTDRAEDKPLPKTQPGDFKNIPKGNTNGVPVLPPLPKTQPGDSKNIPKGNTNGVPVPPPIPAPAPKTPTPQTEAKPSWYPAEGALGRLGGVGVMGGLLGALLLGVNRFQRRHYPDSAALQAASITYHFDFTRSFRSFVALQGAYVLVACVTGAMYAASAVWGDSLGLSFLWFIGGIGGSGLMVVIAGAAGLDLMTQLDSSGTPQKKGSALSRYMKRKLWLILLGGLGIAALGVAFRGMPASEVCWSFAIGSLGIGQAVAYCWGGAKLVEPKLQVPKIQQRKGKLNLPALMVFNMPFLFVLGGLLWAGAIVLFGISWKFLWLGLPLGIFLALGLSIGTRIFPRMVRYWQNILCMPAIAAFVLDWLVWDGFFWLGFIGLAGLMALGARKTKSTTVDEDHGWMLILPEHRGDYQPIINPNRNGLDVRWFQLGTVCLVILALVISAGSFVWGYNSHDEDVDQQVRANQMQDTSEIKDIKADALESRYVPIIPPKGDKVALGQAVQKLAESGYYEGSAEQKLGRAWVHYMHKGYALAAYNYAFLMMRLDESAGDEVRASFRRAAEGGHVPAAYNYGCLNLFRVQMRSEHLRILDSKNDERYKEMGRVWRDTYQRKALVDTLEQPLFSAENSLVNAYLAGHPHAEKVLIAVYGEMDLHGFKPRNSTLKNQLSGKPYNPGPFELDRSDVVMIE